MTTEQSVRTSTIGSRWLRKMAIFAVVLLGFGSWALYDAAWKYPARGWQHAEWAEWQYLNVLEEESRTNRDPGILTRDAPVPDPVGELARLSEDPGRTARPSAAARLMWLESLSRVAGLNAEHTDFRDTSPRQRREQLSTIWQTKSQPTALKSYDIPSQWLMMFVGYGLGLYIVFLVVRVAMTKYRWEPATRTLIVPGGGRITPGDLKEVDKRKWDKFIVFLRVKEGVEKVGGRSIRFDTYRHGLVEDWILEMEREAFGSEEDSAESNAGSQNAGSVAVLEPDSSDEKPTAHDATADADEHR
jgi:hypothetical protein